MWKTNYVSNRKGCCWKKQFETKWESTISFFSSSFNLVDVYIQWTQSNAANFSTEESERKMPHSFDISLTIKHHRLLFLCFFMRSSNTIQFQMIHTFTLKTYYDRWIHLMCGFWFVASTFPAFIHSFSLVLL